MFVACAIVAGLLAVALMGSAVAKLTKVDRVVENLTGAGVPLGWFPWLAVIELAGAAGLVVGLGIEPVGIAAAVGVVFYFIGAVIAHVRVKDYRGVVGPVPLVVAAAAVLEGWVPPRPRLMTTCSWGRRRQRIPGRPRAA